MIDLMALAGFLAAATASRTAIALPVADSSGGVPPFTIQVWPDEGCPGCVIDPADIAVIDKLLDDFKGRHGAPAAYPRARYLIVYGGTANSVTGSIDKLRKTLAECELGSSGILAPNSISNATAYGLRFDCEGKKVYRWMSVVMDDRHEPKTVYFLPERPIFVARTK